MKRIFVMGAVVFSTLLFASCGGADLDSSGNSSDPVTVTGVSLSPDSRPLKRGENVTLSVAVFPANATDKTVTWSSSDPGIATVDEDGTVTGVGLGDAVITVTTTDGGKSAEFKVTIFDGSSYTGIVSSTEAWTIAMLTISSAEDGSASQHRVTELTIAGDFNVEGIGSGSNIIGTCKEVRLNGDGTITLSSKGSLIRTVANQTFVINGPTLHGIPDNDAALVYIEGGSTVKFLDGEIKNNIISIDSSDLSWTSGGVNIDSYGIFIMDGGIISRNRVGGGLGGGVGIPANGTFIMNGGTISGNSIDFGVGGGVGLYRNGIFTMNDGTISGNWADNGLGGGVGLRGFYGFKDYGIFTMNSGTISGNSAVVGGGVYVYEDKTWDDLRLDGATFIMTGGTISGNTSKQFGNGVFGTFTQEGGNCQAD
jgi:hypothetical protein